METPGPTSGSPPVTGTSTTVTAVRWQVGQLLQATVAENIAGKILLSIGNRQVSSETALPLEKGQQLTVLIRSLGDTPVLRITSGPVTSPLVQAIRTLIPQQDSMTPLLASLARLTQLPQPPVPLLIRELIRTLARTPLAGVRPAPGAVPIPATSSLLPAATNPGTASMTLSGVVPPPFPGAAPAPQAAVQATLDLLNRIGNLRIDLLRQTEVALARLQLHQLASQH